MKYLLSNRQRKELFVRGAELRIALPAPPEELADAAAWARTMLSDQDAACVRDADEQELLVRVRRAADGAGLSGYLGDLVETPADDDLVLCVAAVVATLRHADQVRSRMVVQWPGAVRFTDGRMWPAKE